MHNLRWILAAYLLLWLAVAGIAGAAELVQQETYIVADDVVVRDDLYVSATEVIVDGTIDGDLVVLANYVEINGVVTGDLLVGAAAVRITGEIGDDARVLTGSSFVSGRIGDDWVTTGSGNTAAPVPLQTGSRTVDLGIILDGGQVGGDTLIFGGLADLSGGIEGDLRGFVNQLIMTELDVAGGAELTLAAVTADEASRVRGPSGFAYTAAEPLGVPSTVSEEIVYTELPQAETGVDLFTIFRRALGAIAGFALVGWLLLRYRPNWLIEPVAVLSVEPVKCFFVGFIVSLGFLFVPVMTVLLVVSVGFFWGIGLALLVGIVILGVLLLLWGISPLVVGMWAGRRFSSQPFGALLAGTALLVILRQLPLLGLGISAGVFMAALGALILARPIAALPPQA